MKTKERFVEFVDVVRPARDPETWTGTKQGYHVSEGFKIERIEGGAAFRVTHPSKPTREVCIPITNVAGWGETDDLNASAAPDRTRGVRIVTSLDPDVERAADAADRAAVAAAPAMLGESVRRVGPEPKVAQPKAKPAKRAKAAPVEAEPPAEG